MTKRKAATPAPGPLEAYARAFDLLFGKRNQRDAFRRYLEGLLLPAARNKTLTALANTEPIVGAHHPRAQALQWFLSESDWDPAAVNTRRLALLRADPLTAPDAHGVLVIDEHGDRKWGTKTAHVGRQYLANLGKIDTGVVSVTSLWADEHVYYPLEVAPYTPAHHFARGKGDPQFRTKLTIALELVARAVTLDLPFRAVVADSCYGEDEGFKAGLRQCHLGYVLALKPSHAWLHLEGAVGTLWQVAAGAGWQDLETPGAWVKVERTFRDGHTEIWWTLDVQAGPYGVEQAQRAVVVTTDPTTLPDRSTWYLVTNLPAPGSQRAQAEGALPAADLAEVVRLYGLRMWVEQSYKQVKYALGWSQYQVRSDRAIRRHWQLVCCAFSFCWWQHRSAADAGAVLDTAQVGSPAAPPTPTAGMEEKKKPRPSTAAPADLLAGGAPPSTGVAGTVDYAVALLAWVVARAPAVRVTAAA
jgi:SRSO17 transposase